MKLLSLKTLFVSFLFFYLKVGYAQNIPLKYVCMPCGSSCDTLIYEKGGKCTHCGMELVDKKSIVFKEISPAQLSEIVNRNPEVILLDVRTSEEFNGKAKVNSYGRLKNAINIPIQELESRINELKRFKDKEIIVYCSHSHRSPRASYLLTVKGFSNVKNMSGGMSIWESSVKSVQGGMFLFIKH